MKSIEPEWVWASMLPGVSCRVSGAARAGVMAARVRAVAVARRMAWFMGATLDRGWRWSCHRAAWGTSGGGGLGVRDGDVFIVVDVQVGLMREAWEAGRVIGNIAGAVERARGTGVPVARVQHADDELVRGTP